MGCILYELFDRKQAFSGDYGVIQYRLSYGITPLKIPNFPDDCFEGYKYVINMLIRAMLHVESAERPATREILTMLKRRIPNKSLPGETSRVPPFRRKIWVSGCSHRTEYNRIPATSDYFGLSKDTILLPFNSPLWKFVRWLRHWYVITSGDEAKYYQVLPVLRGRVVPALN